MGLWKMLRAPWDIEQITPSTIRAVTSRFQEARTRWPDRDCHYWLVHAYSTRPGYRPGKNVGIVIPFTRTTQFAVLTPEVAPTALAYAFLLREMPYKRAYVEPLWQGLMEPVATLVRQNGFPRLWESLNPWSAANVPMLRESVQHAFGRFDPDTRQLRGASARELEWPPD